MKADLSKVWPFNVLSATQADWKTFVNGAADSANATFKAAVNAAVDSAVTNFKDEVNDSLDKTDAGWLTAARPTIVTEATAARELSASDEGAIILCTNASGCAVTVPDGLPTGFRCRVVAMDTDDAVTVAAAGGATIAAIGATTTAVQGESIEIMVVSAANFVANLVLTVDDTGA